MSTVLVVFGPSQLLQDLTGILLRQVGDVVNPTLTDLQNDLVHDLLRNDGGFLGLELVQDLIQVINLLVGVVVPLLRGITEGRKV